MSFGSKLSEIRIKSEISQEELAERLNVSVQTVHRWEHDKSAPNVNQLKILCKVFDVKSDYFFEESEEVKEQEERVKETLETFAQADVTEEKKGISPENKAEQTKIGVESMLFANKWYYWVCLVPWFIMFAQSLNDGTGLIFSLGSCIVWAVFTLSQELLFHFKRAEEKVQFVLNVIKTLAIMAIALYSAFTSDPLLWRILFIFVCCMSAVICAWEIVLIKNEYKNRKN